MKKIYNKILLMLLLSVFSVTQAEALTPDQLIKQTSDQVLNTLKKNKSEYDKDPDKVFELVNDIIIPHMDFRAMSKLALGQHWRDANESQQEAFVDAFKILLVRTYGRSLSEYTNQTIEYLPYQPPAENKRTVVVQTQIKQDTGPAIPIDYRLRIKDDIWKVFDIKIDGISLVTNYRNSFASDIRKVGMDGLIEKLKSKYEDKATS
ncbi:MAG: ABC transporter substrate-binding protein [Gammaproteobacteria bacterium]|nr:ABC transporter substrate-binding protein [Gammaproteobacteria bacterium]